MTQMNAASCIISQRKTVCLRLLQLLQFCCFGVCLRKSARSAGDIGVSIEYSCLFILPQIAQITLTKDRLGKWATKTDATDKDWDYTEGVYVVHVLHFT